MKIIISIKSLINQIKSHLKPDQSLVNRELQLILMAVNSPSQSIDCNGSIQHRSYGKFHKVDGPAVEYTDGSRFWFINDKLHRTDGPAAEYANGAKQWYIDGKFHRTDGPAIEYANGTKCWFFNGKRHRTDGPAVEFADGAKEWWINGKKITYDTMNNFSTEHSHITDQFLDYIDSYF